MLQEGQSGEAEGSLSTGASWIRPRSTEDDLRRYASLIWRQRVLVALFVLIGVAIATVYVTTTRPVYTAETDLFITPLNNASTATVDLGLITDSGDPTSNIETAARLVTTIQAADATRRALALNETDQQILNRVDAQPVAQSNIVAISATAHAALAAAQLANVFAQKVIATRSAQFHALVQNQINSLEAQLKNTGGADTSVLRAQLIQLRSLLTSQLPDMRISTPASIPSSRTSPKTALALFAGILGGLMAGLAAVFLLEFLDVRVQRPEDLQRLFRLPVLALVPRAEASQLPLLRRLATKLPGIGAWLERRQLRHAAPRAPEALPTVALEAYRTLRATLTTSHRQLRDGGSLLVTSATASEGKTTSAINLACSLAASGRRVILIEADLHRPSIARALELQPYHSISDVLTGQASMHEALLESEMYGASLKFLVANPESEPNVMVADALLLPTTSSLLLEARRMADYVIVDAPPLAEVIDALELARMVDEVLLVVRLGRARVPRLVALGQLLAQAQVTPVGIAVIGVDPPKGLTYGYGYGAYASRASYLAGAADEDPRRPAPVPDPARAPNVPRAAEPARAPEPASGSVPRRARVRD